MSEGIPIVVPHSGVVETVVIIEWLKEPGAAVNVGEEIVLIETEKAETYLEAPTTGTLEILVDADPDADVDVGTTIGNVIQ